MPMSSCTMTKNDDPGCQPSPALPRRPPAFYATLLHQSQEIAGFGGSSVIVINELDISEDHTPPSSWKQEPPDGGYGWAIVTFVFLINVVASGHFVCSGVYLPDLSQHFQRSQAAMAFVLSAETLVNSITLLLTPHLVRCVGERVTCLLGTTISASGILLASLSTHYYMFLATFGVIKSVGTAMTLIPANVMMQKYFSRRRALAAGLGSTGMSAGTLCFSPLHRVMIDAFGWRGGLLLFSGIVYQTLVCAALLRPLGVTNQAPWDGKDTSKDPSVNSTEKVPSKQPLMKHEDEFKQHEAAKADGTEHSTLTSTSIPKRFFMCSKRCNKWLILYTAGKCLSTMGVVVFFKYIVSNAVYQGMDELSASSLPALVGFSSTCSRLGSGLLSNLAVFRHRRLILYAVAVFFNGLVVMATELTEASGYVYYALCSLAFGICFGSHEGISYTVATDIFGLRRLSCVMSLIDSCSGISVCLFLPFVGYLWDVTGEFKWSFLLAGGVQMLGGLVFSSLLIPTCAVTDWDVQTGKLHSRKRGQ